MLRRSAMVVVMLLVSLVMACAPQAVISTPTPVGTSAVPKATSGAVSVATSKPAVEKPQRGGTLVYASPGETAELDPHRITSAVARRISPLMFNTLVNADKDGNIIPELAESWSNPDPKSFVFKLRKGVKFHDGTDFNAEAVKFSIERIQDPATIPGLGRKFLADIASVEVVDDYTVKFNLKIPMPTLLGNLTRIYVGGIVSPTAVKKLGDKTLSNPVGMGTGPFEFVEWLKDDHLTVKRFDGYWRKDEYGDPLPYLDQIIIKPIPDKAVALTNLRTGNVDVMAKVLPEQVPFVEGDKNLKPALSGGSQELLKLNNAAPPFDNKALRQAVAWAIDKEALHKVLYGGVGVAGQYVLPPESWAFDPTGKFYTKDNAKAKQKLAEGGKPDGFKFATLSFNDPFSLRLAQAIKGQLAEVGIEMEIVPMEESQLTATRQARKFVAAFSYTNSVGTDPDLQIYPQFWSGQPQSNEGKYSNPEVDKLLGQARVIYDQAERKPLYAKAQALIVDDSPVIWLHHGRTILAMNQKVMGFVPDPDLYHRFDWFWLKR